MQFDTFTRENVGFIIAMLVDVGGDASRNVVIRRVPFNPCNSDCTGAFGNDRLLKMMPQVTIR